jgi:hypothetical protein
VADSYISSDSSVPGTTVPGMMTPLMAMSLAETVASASVTLMSWN